jgi:hypothetical protein
VPMFLKLPCNVVPHSLTECRIELTAPRHVSLTGS